jgi:hypothetical protein
MVVVVVMVIGHGRSGSKYKGKAGNRCRETRMMVDWHGFDSYLRLHAIVWNQPRNKFPVISTSSTGRKGDSRDTGDLIYRKMW